MAAMAPSTSKPAVARVARSYSVSSFTMRPAESTADS